MKVADESFGTTAAPAAKRSVAAVRIDAKELSRRGYSYSVTGQVVDNLSSDKLD